MIELYKKIISNSFTTEEAIEFIREAAKAINPSVPYNEEYTLIALKSGLGSVLLKGVIESVESNPDKVGFQVTKLYSTLSPFGGRSIIKTIIKKLN